MTHAPFAVIPGPVVLPLLTAHLPQVLERVQRAYTTHQRGDTVLPESPFLRFPQAPTARIIPVSVYLGAPFNVAGIKWIASFPENIRANRPRASAVLLLNDPDTGVAYALLEASAISAWRTAASAVLAAQTLRYPSRQVAHLGFVGTGVIARTIYQLFQGLHWDMGAVSCFDTEPTYAEHFAAMVRASGPSQVTVWEQRDAMLRACDLAVFATTATTPYVHDATLLRPHPLWLHISLRDVAPALLWQAQNIVDDVEHVLQAQTSIHLAVQQSGTRACITGTLGAVLAGTCPIRADAPLIFSPFGLGVLDLAVGQYVYALAMAQETPLLIPEFCAETTRW